MNTMTKNMAISLIAIIAGGFGACYQGQANASPREITYKDPALYPEGIAWDAVHGQFLVSSMHKGIVTAVKVDGSTAVFARDQHMISSVGLHIDAKRDRVLVCNSDAGASEYSTKETHGKIAGLAAFRLSTGKLIKYVDLAKGIDGGHFCNDLAIADDGTAYITDSFSPIIYKVDSKYNSTVLINDKTFTGRSFNLNGIVVKDNYLLVDKMNSGQIFKIPLSNPQSFSEVKLPLKLRGSDGMLWAKDGSLIVIANDNAHIDVKAEKNPLNAVFRLTSNDGWKSATIKGRVSTGDVFATTGTLKNGDIYVNHAMLHVLFNPKTKNQVQQFHIVNYNP